MLKAQLEVENVRLRGEIEELRNSLTVCNEMLRGGDVSTEEHVKVLKRQMALWQHRVYDLERVMEKVVLPEFVARCDMLGLKEHDGIDIGVRAGDLREAYKVLSAEPEEELKDLMDEPVVEMDDEEIEA